MEERQKCTYFSWCTPQILFVETLLRIAFLVDTF